MNKSSDYLNNLNKKRTKKTSLEDKKFTQSFLTAPMSNYHFEKDQSKTYLRKSPSTPLTMYRKTNSSINFFS